MSLPADSATHGDEERLITKDLRGTLSADPEGAESVAHRETRQQSVSEPTRSIWTFIGATTSRSIPYTVNVTGIAFHFAVAPSSMHEVMVTPISAPAAAAVAA